MPEVRRFFYDSVLKREYGDQLDVKFVPGANPELVLYDENDAEIERVAVGRMSFDDLHELAASYGFTKVAPEEEQAVEAEGAQDAPAPQQEL